MIQRRTPRVRAYAGTDISALAIYPGDVPEISRGVHAVRRVSWFCGQMEHSNKNKLHTKDRQTTGSGPGHEYADAVDAGGRPR
jgi:hypothetical protein